MKKNITLFYFLISMSVSSIAQVNFLKDIDPRTTSSGGPSQGISIGNTIFFYEYNETYGMELWKSDGTTAGTVIVKDINPGTQSGNGNYEWNVFNNELYFSANDGINGDELWKTDGTTEGTVLVKDIRAGDKGSNLYNLTVYKNKIYFFAYNGNDTSLYETDGTSNGTRKIRKADGNTNYLTVFKELLYFTGDDPNNFDDRKELWKSDGSQAGTLRVRLSGSGYAFGPSNFYVAGDVMYFTANDVNGSRELWKTDGTDAGTTLVKDINTREIDSDSYPKNFIQFNNEVFFYADDGVHGNELWKTNGTEQGTVLVKDIKSGISGSSSGDVPIIYKNHLYFIAADDTHALAIYKTDGTETGTLRVTDNHGSKLKVFNDKIFFSGYTIGDTDFDSELWTTDGTISGTELVEDINAGRRGSGPNNFIIAGNSLFFEAYTEEYGIEMYVFNDTTANLTNEEILKEDISIFPNPFSEELNIHDKLNTIIKIDFYNLIGTKIYTVKNKFENISTSNFTSGIYIAKIYTSKKIYSKKIIRN